MKTFIYKYNKMWNPGDFLIVAKDRDNAIKILKDYLFEDEEVEENNLIENTEERCIQLPLYLSEEAYNAIMKPKGPTPALVKLMNDYKLNVKNE